jgi:hypothetical protein
MATGRSALVIPGLPLLIIGGVTHDSLTYIFQEYMTYSGNYFNGLTQQANYLGHPSFLSDEPALKRFLSEHGRWRVTDIFYTNRVPERGPAFIRMLTTLRKTMSILGREPVMIDTGQYQAKYQQRTFADMENQLANELVQLGNFHARVKLLTAEHTIKTLPAPQGLTGEVLTTRINRIKRQMRFLGYTRDAAEVEEEVRKRHNRLCRNRLSDDPPPTHF